MEPIAEDCSVDDVHELDQGQCIICGGEGFNEHGFIVSDLEEF